MGSVWWREFSIPSENDWLLACINVTNACSRMYIMPGNHYCSSQCSQLGNNVQYFPHSSINRILHHYDSYPVGMKLPSHYELYFFMFCDPSLWSYWNLKFPERKRERESQSCGIWSLKGYRFRRWFYNH